MYEHFVLVLSLLLNHIATRKTTSHKCYWDCLFIAGQCAQTQPLPLQDVQLTIILGTISIVAPSRRSSIRINNYEGWESRDKDQYISSWFQGVMSTAVLYVQPTTKRVCLSCPAFTQQLKTFAVMAKLQQTCWWSIFRLMFHYFLRDNNYFFVYLLFLLLPESGKPPFLLEDQFSSRPLVNYFQITRNWAEDRKDLLSKESVL